MHFNLRLFPNKRSNNDSFQKRKKEGFTLIELLVAITILSIVSSIGLTTYSKAQVVGRDSRRKQDLRTIQIALSLYNNSQSPKHYPVYGAAGYPLGSTAAWCASDESCWTDSTILSTNYINKMPADPENDSSAFKMYLYRSNDYGPAPVAGCKAGEYYVLVTFLENTNDPDRLQAKDVSWCDGSSVQAAYSSRAIYPRMFVIVGRAN